MRNVWILGGDAQVKLGLERALDSHKDVSEWCVRLATAVSDIPEDDILSDGTLMICDAFHPTFPAFEGVKALRGSGFGGPIFLAGEPSPELSVAPFHQHRLTGYFPSFDRADWSLIAGILRNQLYFSGEFDVKTFLMPQGRASSELIKDFKDFNNFGAKLAIFVQKFGIDLLQVKKLLMGLGLPHVKGSSSGPTVEKPFQIYFGMDPLKIILSVSTYSRGTNYDSLLGEFTQVISNLKDKKPNPGTIFPEFYHVAQATQNMILLSGNCANNSPEFEPLFIVGAIPFPKAGGKALGAINLFSFQNVCATAEASAAKPESLSPAAPAVAPIKILEKKPAPASTLQWGAAPEADTPSADSAPAPQGMIQEQSLGSILSEPQLVGDAVSVVNDNPVLQNSNEAKRRMLGAAVSPLAKSASSSKVEKRSSGPASSSTHSLKISQGSQESDLDWAPKLERAEKDLEKLKLISEAMSQDVRRLMKERRVPSTDRELRDAVAQLEEKLKRANQDRTKYQRLCEEREHQIETLKIQVDTLRKKVA